MRLLAVLAAVVAATVVLVSPASASSPTVVKFFACGYGSGHVTVAAGTPFVLRAGWVAKNRGFVQNFLHAVAAKAWIDGVPVADATSYFSTPQYIPEVVGYGIPGWGTYQYFPTADGVTLAPGQSLTLTLEWSLSHRVWDGVTLLDNGEHANDGSGVILGMPLTCTVTGV